jgi:hypothetical protein
LNLPSAKTVRLPALLAALLLLAACAQTTSYQEPQVAGHEPAGITESSGIAASHRDRRLLWTHNDSGGEPVLYGIDPTGARRGDVRLAGVHNTDWEDIASFELDGRAWILVADTGDNSGVRHDCALYVIAEPDPTTLSSSQELTVPVAWKIPVRFPDGPHDCEAVAVDPVGGLVYLLTKRTTPPALYTLPLRPAAGAAVPAALRVAQLRQLPQPSLAQSLLPIPTSRYRGQPTGMDFASDGSAAVVLTYGEVCLFPRQPGETWVDALSREPRVLAPHGLLQAEGVAFGQDSRTLYVTSEGSGSAILRYRPEK